MLGSAGDASPSLGVLPAWTFSFFIRIFLSKINILKFLSTRKPERLRSKLESLRKIERNSENQEYLANSLLIVGTQ